MLALLEHRFRRRTVWLISALVVLSGWAILRHDILFARWSETDQVAYMVDYLANVVGGDPSLEGKGIPGGFLGYVGLLDCTELNDSWRPHWVNENCRTPTGAELGSLKDPMLATGYLAALLGLWITVFVEKLYVGLNQQMLRDQIVPWSQEDIARIDEIAKRLSLWVASAICVVLIVGFLGFHHEMSLPKEWFAWEHFLSSVILGVITGLRMGTVAAMGWMGRTIACRDAPLSLVLGHSDEMAGMKRFGEFIAFLAILNAIPIFWLSTWIALLVAHPLVFAGLQQWVVPFVLLLLIALFVAWLSFFSPVIHFSRRLRVAKAEALKSWGARTETDLSRLVQNVKTKGWKKAAEAMEQINLITSVPEHVAKLPESPIGVLAKGSVTFMTFAPPIFAILEILLPVGLFGFLESVAGLVSDMLPG